MFKSRAEGIQDNFFGSRYVGANLSGLRLNEKDALTLSNWLKGNFGILLLSGNPGCGKTWVCAACLDWMVQKTDDIYAFTETRFFQKIRDSFDKSGDYQQALEYEVDHDFLIFDDLGSTGDGKSEWRKEIVFSFVDNRYSSKKPTIITTNFNPSQIKEKFGDRTYSRIFSEENRFMNMFDYPDLRNPNSSIKNNFPSKV